MSCGPNPATGSILLAAIQGLNQKLEQNNIEIQRLKEKADKVDSPGKQLMELKQTVQAFGDKR